MSERVKKWTKGKWKYIECADDFDNACGVGMASYLEDPHAYECHHLWTCEEGEGDEEAIANAHIMAAAPALVEALEQAVTSMLDSGYSPRSVVVQECQRALDLAYGETQ